MMEELFQVCYISYRQHHLFLRHISASDGSWMIIKIQEVALLEEVYWFASIGSLELQLKLLIVLFSERMLENKEILVAP